LFRHLSGEIAEYVRASIEMVCDKLGVVLVVPGVMHFFNIYIFNRLRRNGQTDRAQVPVH
jgi:hypothetical protein